MFREIPDYFRFVATLIDPKVIADSSNKLNDFPSVI